MILHGIDGRVHHVVRNMYIEAKSCGRRPNECSDFFLSCAGVREGTNVSPVSFALFFDYLRITLECSMDSFGA